MMLSVEKWANKKGYNRFYVDSLNNNKTIRFYESCGFSVVPNYEEVVGGSDFSKTIRMIKESESTINDS